MAHVIGIPLIKGNSNVVLSGHLRGGLKDTGFEGQAVGFTGVNSVEPNLVPLDDVDSKGFYGFIFDINKCSHKASVLRCAESVALPSDGSMAGTGGAQVLIDPATGLISSTGTIPIGGYVINDGAGTLAAVSGKDGTAVADPVLISLHIAANVNAITPPVVTITAMAGPAPTAKTVAASTKTAAKKA